MLEFPKLPEDQFKGLMSLIVLSRSRVEVKKTLLKLILESGFFTRPVRCTIDSVSCVGKALNLPGEIGASRIDLIFQTAGVKFKIMLAHGYYDASGKFEAKTLPGDRLTFTLWLSQIKNDPQAHDISRAEITDVELIKWVELAPIN